MLLVEIWLQGTEDMPMSVSAGRPRLIAHVLNLFQPHHAGLHSAQPRVCAALTVLGVGL